MSKNKSMNIQADVAHKGIYSALIKLVHFIAVIQFSYAIYYDFVYVHAQDVPELKKKFGNQFGGKFRYLTFIDAIIQSIYFTICVLNGIFGTNQVTFNKNLPLIRRLKDFIFASLAFPVAMNVGITFWTLMAIDRELVFPKALDVIFPMWLNHVMHTNIMVFIVLEMFISFRIYPKRREGLGVLALFMVSYLLWIHIIRYFSGIWVYPILEVLDLPARIMFYIIILGFTFSLYLIGEYVNNTIWRKEINVVCGKAK